jgi:hypothetical protein
LCLIYKPKEGGGLDPGWAAAPTGGGGNPRF